MPDPARSGWFRPVVDASWRAAALLFGTDPLGHHAINFGLHLVNVCLVFRIARGVSADNESAAASASLFGVGALTPAAVAWLSGRFDVLSSTFALVALAMATRPRDARAALPFVIALVLAALSQESAFVLPVAIVIAVGSWRVVGPDANARLRRFAVLGAAALGMVFVYRMWMLSGLGGYGIHGRFTWSMLPTLAVLWPLTFQPVALVSPWDNGTLSWVAMVVASVGSCAAAWAGRPRFAVAALVCLVPISNLITDPLTVPHFEIGRFLYLPSAFAAVAMGTGLAGTRGGRRWLGRALLGLAVLLSCQSASARADSWRRAAVTSRAVDATLRARGPSLPPNVAIDCSALADNVEGAYLYRNGCDDHVRLATARRDIRGVRFVRGVPPDPVSEGLSRFDHVFTLSADGHGLEEQSPAR